MERPGFLFFIFKRTFRKYQIVFEKWQNHVFSLEKFTASDHAQLANEKGRRKRILMTIWQAAMKKSCLHLARLF